MILSYCFTNDAVFSVLPSGLYSVTRLRYNANDLTNSEYEKIIQHIRWFLIQEWKMYVLMFLLLLSIATFALIPGWLLGLSIDTIISGGLTWSPLTLLTISVVIKP